MLQKEKSPSALLWLLIYWIFITLYLTVKEPPTAIIEESLAVYLEKVNAKELEKYVKVIECKPKPQPELSPYFLRGFGCDRCGSEYYDETAYSYAPSMDEINNYHTYCSDCVVVEE